MDNKKILILMPALFIGGAERSLIGLLESIDLEKYDVDLFLYQHDGDFMGFIPEGINLLPEVAAYNGLSLSILELLRKKRLLLVCSRLVAKFAMFINSVVFRGSGSAFNNMSYIGYYLLPLLPKVSGTYDLGINFLGSNDILLKRVNAKVKAGWVHTDYSSYNNIPTLDNLMWRRWSGVDYIVNVSGSCTEVFKECFPFLADKCITIENIVSPAFVREQSNMYSVDEFAGDRPIVCSVGRFSYAKNFDSIPAIVAELKQRGLSVSWFLIGYGSDEAIIHQKIKEYGVTDSVIILGKKTNPYPYIHLCDIYVQPSRFEGKAVTVREAQILGKPVLITNYKTAESQLEDGVDGLVVPLTVKGVAGGVELLINDNVFRKRLIENTIKRDYGNVGEVDKVYGLLR